MGTGSTLLGECVELSHQFGPELRDGAHAQQLGEPETVGCEAADEQFGLPFRVGASSFGSRSLVRFRPAAAKLIVVQREGAREGAGDFPLLRCAPCRS